MNDEGKEHQPRDEASGSDRASREPRCVEKVRIDRRIGDDPEELKAVAEQVVRGEPIKNAEIKSLRKLIETVQLLSDARLAPPKDDRPDDWLPPSEYGDDRLTKLEILGGIILDGDYQELDVRVTLVCSARFVGDVSFEKTSFAGVARFDGASFAGVASFDRAKFWQTFGSSSFNGVRFYRIASFNYTIFCGGAMFGQTTFRSQASFHKTSFSSWTSFYEARFEGEARFDYAIFERIASFDRTTFVGAATFHSADFANAVEGDFRGAGIRTARFAEVVGQCIAWRHQIEYFGGDAIPWMLGEFTKRFRRVHHWQKRRFGWGAVRGLGQLSILSRVSLIALIFVPVIAAFWPSVRAAASAYHRYVGESHAAMDRLLVEARKVTSDEVHAIPKEFRTRMETAITGVETASDGWHRHMDGLVSKFPCVGPTLVFTFFAAVAITLGLLVYQVAGPEEVRKFDEDEFTDRAHQRYPEGAADRDDGLRRAIKHLEDIATIRPDRHRNFVTHHGDTIWVPPGEKIEWFNDLMEEPETVNAPAGKGEVPSGGTKSVALVPRAGQVPGAERRRIVIEEGARAEYWLKSRENVGWAGISFGLYGIGIMFLLAILGIQIWNVMKAAGWVGQ